MRYVGLDYGSKTLGVSISDETHTIASSLLVIKFNNHEELFKELDKVMNNYKIEKIVLGNPLNLDGSISKRCEITNEFKKDLEKRYNIEVILVDERLTTTEANKILLLNNTKRNNRKKVIDKMAANIILQSYLDRK